MSWLSKSRRKLLLKAFVVGACAPAVWVGIQALKDLPINMEVSPILGWFLYAVFLITFPTNFVFLDAEHPSAIVFLLIVVAPVNGAWYVLLTILFLFVNDALQRRRRVASL